MLLRIHPDNPDDRQLRQVVETLENGGIIIYPTDTVYAIGCSILKPKAIDKVARLKGTKIEKADFSFIFYDLSQLSEYTRHVSTPIYKIIRRNTPGPFTFILEANSNIPKLFKHKKKTIGIRIPDNNIVRDVVKMLGHPIITTSIHDDDEILEYTTDPELIHEKYQDQVDLVIDGGYGSIVASSIVDCTTDEIEIVREGIKELEL
jgi:tRNA threonylcarbamoyl adenosine modification protein (Sua5/YciO/YrdC/YwlC family)